MLILGILLVCLSAFTHATWNFICKSRTPSGAFFVLLTVASIVFLSPALYFGRSLFTSAPSQFWWLLLATGVVQAIYYLLLAKSYQLADISVAYPLVRSVPVLLTPLAVALCGIGAELPLKAVIGMVLIFSGCLILPLKRFSELFKVRSYWNYGMCIILLTAVGVTTYSVIDGTAVKLLPREGVSVIVLVCFFQCLENILIEMVLLPYVLLRRMERNKLQGFFHDGQWRYALIAGLTCSGGYALVLAGMTMAENVSYVVALRQLSIPIGAFLGIWLLKEPLTRPKLAGLLLLVSGLITVAIVSAS